MFNAGKIITGIAIFLLLVTFPFWYGKGRTMPPPKLSLDTPEIQKLAEKRCVEATPFMKANHMELLDTWRDEVVRRGMRIYTAADGRKFTMSLSRTCLGCHSNKDQFCDRCHDYAGGKPNCFSCHTIPKEVQR
jgi:hypothetical protein